MQNPKSLAIDWIGERIYILDAGNQNVVTTDLNGGNQVLLVASSGPPIDIVVEPNSRMMFWSTLDHGILSASMDGANKQILVDRGIEWATGLTIDHPAQRLYWADHRKGTIETILLNGKSRHIVTQFKNRSEFFHLLLHFFSPKVYLFCNFILKFAIQLCCQSVYKYSKTRSTLHCTIKRFTVLTSSDTTRVKF